MLSPIIRSVLGERQRQSSFLDYEGVRRRNSKVRQANSTHLGMGRHLSKFILEKWPDRLVAECDPAVFRILVKQTCTYAYNC
jgi:hypothetical protein